MFWFLFKLNFIFLLKLKYNVIKIIKNVIKNKIKRINQFIGAICGIKKYFIIILIWQINVILILTNFFFIRSNC